MELFGIVEIGRSAGLWALLFIVPLIILYLIRPRPKLMTIPSLMFFMKSSGATKLTSFLRQFLRDWLFLLQFLIIFLLASTLAQPFTSYYHDITSENTVIVIDVSASSQTKENGKTRFDIAVEKARSLLGAKNTIILAKDVAQIGIQDADFADSIEYLNALRPKDTTSRIGDAIILGGEVLAGKEGRIIVLSDFINTAGQDPHIAKAVVESRGTTVDFINTATGEHRTNIGIVDMLAEPTTTTIYVKNYEPTQQKIKVSIGTGAKDLTLAAHSIETFSIITPPDLTKITLNVQDDFPVDNTVYLSSPSGAKTKALLITNNASIFLKNALLASGETELTIAEPPIIPKDNFDVYIIHNINPKNILPGTFEDLARKAEDGASIVIGAQEDSDKIDYKGLLPVDIGGRSEGGFITVDQLNKFTRNIEFGAVDYFFSTTPKENTLTVLSVVGKPLVAIGRKGKGKLAYYGILEKSSDFPYSPGYPIFWTEFIRFLTDQQDVRNLNYKTGDTIILDALQRIETPTKILKKSAMIFEEAGVYKFEDGRTLAVNLLSERESDINANTTMGAKSTEFELKPVKEKRKFEFEMPFVLLALILLFIELLYVKMRGLV
ncbi:MAG: BatA and WFA domain-containing protein [Candidatus Woesearchaeota archaeon]